MSLLLVNKQIYAEAIRCFFAVNEFLIQRQLITSSFLRSFLPADSPLKYIRHISLETDWYTLRNIGENAEDLLRLLRCLPINFPTIRYAPSSYSQTRCHRHILTSTSSAPNAERSQRTSSARPTSQRPDASSPVS